MGDVVVFIYPKSEDIDYVFRVVAVAGDTVSVLEDVVYRNGDVQASDYVNSDKSRLGKTIGNVSIPEGEFLCLVTTEEKVTTVVTGETYQLVILRVKLSTFGGQRLNHESVL